MMSLTHVIDDGTDDVAVGAAATADDDSVDDNNDVTKCE
jgi:hypothetical protein